MTGGMTLLSRSVFSCVVDILVGNETAYKKRFTVDFQVQLFLLEPKSATSLSPKKTKRERILLTTKGSEVFLSGISSMRGVAGKAI